VWPVLLVAFNGREDVLAASCEDHRTSTPRLAFSIRQLELPFPTVTFVNRLGDLGVNKIRCVV
jgi:hypothetical protein